jgi:hypothetical protein
VKTTPGKKAFQALRDNMGDDVSFMDLAKDIFQIGKGIIL